MSDNPDLSSRPTSKHQKTINEEEEAEPVESQQEEEIVVVVGDGNDAEETGDGVSQEEKPIGNKGENEDYSQENSAVTSPQLETLEDALEMGEDENGDLPLASLDSPDVDHAHQQENDKDDVDSGMGEGSTHENEENEDSQLAPSKPAQSLQKGNAWFPDGYITAVRQLNRVLIPCSLGSR